MKLVIITGIWRRPKIVGYFKTFFERVRDDFKGLMDIECVIVGSEGKQSKDLCITDGMYYIEHRNQPLSEKMNTTSIQADERNADYVLCMGSDDIFCSDLMQHYYNLMKEGKDYICLRDCYFFDVESKGALYWAGYQEKHRKGNSAGIGRCLSRRLANKLDWRFWPAGKDLVLDAGMDIKLRNLSYTKTMLSCRNLNSLALDIKSPTNMTPFTDWPGTNRCDGKEILYAYLPQSEADKIYNHE